MENSNSVLGQYVEEGLRYIHENEKYIKLDKLESITSFLATCIMVDNEKRSKLIPVLEGFIKSAVEEIKVRRYNAEYYQSHLPYFKAREIRNRAIKRNCECGGKYSVNSKHAHFKTKKHQRYVNANN